MKECARMLVTGSLSVAIKVVANCRRRFPVFTAPVSFTLSPFLNFCLPLSDFLLLRKIRCKIRLFFLGIPVSAIELDDSFKGQFLSVLPFTAKLTFLTLSISVFLVQLPLYIFAPPPLRTCLQGETKAGRKQQSCHSFIIVAIMSLHEDSC